jgi:cell division septation protein DedD
MSYHSGPADPEADGAPDGSDVYSGPRPGRPLLRIILVAVVMTLFAGSLWYAYDHVRSRSPGEVPLIRADISATKARPEQPGGMAIPDQDKLVYNQGRAQPQVEKLLPPPETPLPRPVAAAEPIPEPPVAPVVPPSTPGPGPATLPAEAAVSTVVTRPQPVAAVPPAAPAQPVAVTPPPKPAPVAVAAPPATVQAPTKAPAGGGFRLQLAALRSEDAAKKEWSRIKQANKDLLGAYAAAWPRVDLGDRGIYYRLQAGPVSDGAAAERVCSELKRRNVGCILVRP